ncbi:MAG: endonuclease/exonuclease/phosphatase family protein [Planctomycetes bacterium]|nr:endonuclease/exonuclease/phosphatase family protein [Planctomycetota bacterium]
MRTHFAVLVTIALLAMPSCRTCPAPGPRPDQLRVLVWNVLHGANDVDDGPEKALQVIRDADVDVVLLQESYDIDGDRPTLGRWLAAELGWQAHQADSPHLCVLTRLAIDEPYLHHPWHGVGARLRDDAGRAFVAYSIWIDYRAFLGYELRDDPDLGDQDLLAAEDQRSSRLPQTRALLAHLDQAGHLDADVPVLVGGDWNTPSHLDWTADTARIYRNRRALPLPVSQAVHDAGFVDVFRAVHPNAVQRPGITWTPMFRAPRDGTPQAFDRIDRLYLKGADQPAGGWRLTPVGAAVLPAVWEDETTAIRDRAFPSDHGAVLLELRWTK